jgi:hypothetical protein
MDSELLVSQSLFTDPELAKPALNDIVGGADRITQDSSVRARYFKFGMARKR